MPQIIPKKSFVKTITTNTVERTINAKGPDLVNMSVEPIRLRMDGKVNAIDLVIGAPFNARSASSLSKKGVLELASMLIEIADAMEND
jgi:hypothetical protein